jgi:ribosome-binding factor A
MSSPKSAKAPSQRMLRVGELVRHALNESFQKSKIIDPIIEKNFFSISQVVMSPDLSHATVYISCMMRENQGALVDALNKNARFIRGTLGAHLRQLRIMPLINFRKDTSFDNYAKIDSLLRTPEVARDLKSSHHESEA